MFIIGFCLLHLFSVSLLLFFQPPLVLTKHLIWLCFPSFLSISTKKMFSSCLFLEWFLKSKSAFRQHSISSCIMWLLTAEHSPVLHPPFRASVLVTLHPCTTVPTTSLPLLLETDSCLLDQLRSKKAKYFIFIYSSLMLFLSSWRSEFLTHIIFLFPEELLMFLIG